GSPTPGPGETSFMNIVDGGRSFVYVVDVSSSMSEGQRLELAKSQLKGSLHRLQPSQKFQVLFYNETTVQMRLRRRPADDLYTATAVQLQLADDEIDRVQPSGGTEHRTPLLHALRLEPEVVYFLTDGDQPELSTQGKDSDLAQLGRANRSGARIHVIEFGSGGRESRHVSWLELLAHRFGGRYQYIHVGSRRQN
ncbi:MAG: VWA domain-containing protein, partial [Planctomycetaceae bacterium]|nr:VWA domain-containing protein [Planctomycetaceae bacterium]